MQFDWYILGTVLAGISSAFFGLFVYYNKKDRVGLIFMIFSLAFSLWTLPYAIWLAQPDAADALFWSRVLNLGATFIPIFYIHWVVLELGVQLKNRRLLIVGYVATLFYVLFSFSPFYISGVVPVGGFPFWPQANFLYIAFLFTICLPLFIYGMYLLTRALLKSSSDQNTKSKSRYMLLGSVMSTVGGTANFLLMFGIPFIAPQFTLLTIFQSIFWAYGSMQGKMFNVKTIATEILVFGLWVFLLVRTILFVKTSDQIIEGVLLLITVVLGMYLIRSVDKEVEQREKLQVLAKDLESANIRLTELDRQKSEFVSFATHQLRAPLTAIKGYASMILEGDMGDMTKEARLGISRIYDSAQTLTSIVDDYLNLTRIELGTMKYAFETIDCKKLVEDILGELKPNIEKSGLTFTFNAKNHNTDYRITADRDKFKQVIMNLIDNSIKYTPKGTVTLTLSFDHANHKIVFTIKDTGIGIAREVLPHLFLKWSRANNANKTNIKGTGLGLFVAKEIITAHHGTVRAESEGEGKGSTFIVEMEPFGMV